MKVNKFHIADLDIFDTWDWAFEHLKWILKHVLFLLQPVSMALDVP